MFHAIDKLSFIASRVAMMAAAIACSGMIVVVLYEVLARYAFGAPTLWAFDLAWMLNGAVFLLGAAYTLRLRQHVVIDVFSNMMRRRVREGVFAAVIVFLFVPAAGLLTVAAWEQTFAAYRRGELIPVSSWKAVIWPFRLCIAVGLSALILEAINQGLQAGLASAGYARKVDETDVS